MGELGFQDPEAEPVLPECGGLWVFFPESHAAPEKHDRSLQGSSELCTPKGLSSLSPAVCRPFLCIVRAT